MGTPVPSSQKLHASQRSMVEKEQLPIPGAFYSGPRLRRAITHRSAWLPPGT